MTFNIADLPSHTPDFPHRSALRVDPYWDGLWHHGSTAQWASRQHLARLERAGVAGRFDRLYRTDRDEALARIDHDWQPKLDLMGALCSWRTMTAEQFAALSGRKMTAPYWNRVLGDLFALDLIDLGELWTPGREGPAAARTRMLRPAASKAFEKLLAPRMTYAERVSVTAGEQFLTGGQYDRHNLLTVELALRVAEFLPVATILGERQAVATKLAYESAALPIPPGSTNRAGDAVIIRPDGVRIVIETTASWSRTAEAKAEMWARTLARRPYQESGIIVVFVITDRHDVGTATSSRGSIASQVRKSIVRAVRAAPGTRDNWTASRMFVVDWRDWFPERGKVTSDFLTLTAKRPVGPNGEWVPTSILSTSELATPRGERADTLPWVAHYASGLRLVPHQLRRNRRRPNLSRYPLADLGFADIPRILLDPETNIPRDDPRRGYGIRKPGDLVPKRLRF